MNKIGKELSVSRESFIENMNRCTKECQILNGSKDVTFLFGTQQKVLKNVKAFMGFVNSLLKQWGLCVNMRRKSIRIKKMQNKTNEYYLGYYREINTFL